MPFPTRTVFNVLVDARGVPLVNVPVKASLLLPKLSRQYQSEALPKVVTTETDANGRWELTLVCNDALDDPLSYYLVEEGDGTEVYHKHAIRVLSGTDPVWIGDILLPEEPRCSPQLVAILHSTVTSIRANNDTPLKGDIQLKEGTEITLVSDYVQRSITIHGRSLTGELGIEVLDDPPYNKRIRPVYASSPPPPIASASSIGTVSRFAREDHTHEGVHSLNSLLGDVTLEATQGLRSVVDPTTSNITLKDTMYAFLPPSCWKGNSMAQRATFFGWTDISLPYVAMRGESNITSVLTDNDDATYVALNSTSGNIVLTLSDSDFVGKVDFKVTAVRTAGNVQTSVKDSANSVLYSDGAYVSTAGWYSILFTNIYQANWGKYIELLPAGSPAPDIDISEIRVYRGAAYDAWMPNVPGSGPNYVEGWIICPIFLYGGWSYKYRIYLGVDRATVSENNYAKVEGRIYASNGNRTDFLPVTTIPKAQPSERVFVTYSGTLLSPTADDNYTLAFRLTYEIYEPGPYPIPFFLGMLIEYE